MLFLRIIFLSDLLRKKILTKLNLPVKSKNLITNSQNLFLMNNIFLVKYHFEVNPLFFKSRNEFCFVKETSLTLYTH